MSEQEIKAAAEKIFPIDMEMTENGIHYDANKDDRDIWINGAEWAIEEFKKSPEFYKILNQVKDKGYYDL